MNSLIYNKKILFYFLSGRLKSPTQPKNRFPLKNQGKLVVRRLRRYVRMLHNLVSKKCIVLFSLGRDATTTAHQAKLRNCYCKEKVPGEHLW